ncbi:Rne/Rng family ribonuclease [Desulfobulbus alkaliphilus]|uniref:Rne/Rng family ribonuclease n=1 Tax=Desulfobulbus alkaliphilus TaxID=869814 RepID=UPI0019664B59|nr:Rne/Rng family ribonuclease [Desulfobulbus alkaliphilus]MBM9536066.1 Rne/Rng family ribonuclease [Desulfobulbus alkaliphilus]
MTEHPENEKKKKTPPVRKAKTGAWWKSVPTTPDPEPSTGNVAADAVEPVARLEPETGIKSETNPSTTTVQTDREQRDEQGKQTQPASGMSNTPPASVSERQADTATVLPPIGDELAEADPLSPEFDQPVPAGEEGETAVDQPAAKKRRSRRSAKKHNRRGENKKMDDAESSDQPAEPEREEDSDVTVPDEPEADETLEATATPAKAVAHKLLINAEEPEECRIALVEDGRLESFHVTTIDREPTKNNIYKGRVVSIEANLQAAFVDIGTGRNGFLPFNEIHPEYFREDLNERNRNLIAQHQWKKLKIEEVMQRGQEVLVQVVKEVTGNKGANMTTFLSLPGRCLVLMPGSDSAGISRKIVGEERRAALREIMSELDIPEGIGYIIRTASAEITKAALQKDLQYLLTLWEEIKNRGQNMTAPALIFEEQDTVIRFLRDHFFPDIQEILVDTQESLDNVIAFVEQLPSKQQRVKVRLHRGSKPIFNQYNIEEQIESIYKPQVTLPSGGSIVINPTEALVAIDVNSGRTSKNSDFEETIFLANMEAAAELARQLRLRDLGGLIVVDFIDMRNKKHIREVERQVKLSMKKDKAKVDISKISRFGLMQISRQKMGAPIEKGSYFKCENCQGRGVVRSVETQALYYLRRIQTGITRKKVSWIECQLPLNVAQYLLNKKRAELSELEEKNNARIDIIPRVEMKPSEHQINFLDAEPKG